VKQAAYLAKKSNRLRLLVDMDGVLYRGGEMLSGVPEFFAWIEERGHGYMLVTNNATRTPEEVALALDGMGLSVSPEKIITSAIATAEWLRREAPSGARVHVLGGPGVMQAVYAPGSGFELDWSNPEYVVVSQDFDITFQKLAAACFAVQRGARLVATNPDTTFPTERGLVPGAGAWQLVVELVTGVEPVVIGKPGTAILEMGLRAIEGDGEVLVVGDRLDTDILAGVRLGVSTALVLTGVSTREEAKTGEIKPTLIAENLPELTAALDAAPK